MQKIQCNAIQYYTPIKRLSNFQATYSSETSGQCSAVQCNAMQCNAIQFNSSQVNSIQYNSQSLKQLPGNLEQCNETSGQYNTMQCQPKCNVNQKVMYTLK